MKGLVKMILIHNTINFPSWRRYAPSYDIGEGYNMMNWIQFATNRVSFCQLVENFLYSMLKDYSYWETADEGTLLD